MSKPIMKKSLTVAMGATFLTAMGSAGIVSADNSPFGMQNLESGYMQVAEGKCGEGKCGGKKAKEAKCGEGKCGNKKHKEGKCGEKKHKEAKCGEAKCGGKK